VLKLFQRFPDLVEAEQGAPLWRALPFFRGLEVYQVMAP
jgi:hypothetical protein